MRRITLPMSRQILDSLRAGESLLLSGTVYSARDVAHMRIVKCIQTGTPIPFLLREQTIFYLGPAATKPGEPIGAAGPTSSYRMDAFTPQLLRLGLQAMIGKGPRSQTVIDAVKETGAVYFAAVGGTAALLSKHITACQVIAYEDLGPEAICKLELDDFPVVVALDRYGGNQYVLGPMAWQDKTRERNVKLLHTASAGTESTEDLKVSVVPSEHGIHITVKSTVGELFAKQIETSAREVIDFLGIRNCEMEIEDKSALDYVVRARVEAALRRGMEGNK